MKIDLTPEQIDLILTMANDYLADLGSVDYPDDTSNIESLITTIKESVEHDKCPSCSNRYWFIVLNDHDAGNHIERCDACSVFNDDHDAESFAIRSGQASMVNFKFVYTKE